MHSADGSSIFRPVVRDQAVATLLLIENSQEMMSIWPNLRDQHLPTLIGTIRIANPVAPIKIMMLTSSPVDEQISTAKRPREYYELPDVPFDPQPDNKISIATISRGIDLLASTGLGQATARHVVIVAASAPAEDIVSSNSGDDRPASGWHFLAQKLTQEDIQCHMILNPNHNMSAFTELFYETLRLQFFEEVAPWFPTNENYLFHLSARPFRHELGYGVGTQAPCTNSFQRLEHPSLHRNYTFPPDVHPVSALDELSPTMVTSESQTDISAPSLVARLQQAHGLTKKKIYGTKPSRQPFFREDRVRAKYRRAPTPLAIPPSLSETSPATVVHLEGSTSRPQFDRNLLGDQGLQPSPTDRHSRSRRRSSWSRRGSRVSSPETDTSLSSPTSVSTYNTVSPVLPMLPDFDQFSKTMSSPITMSGDGLLEPIIDSMGIGSLRPMDPAARMTEPTWLQGQYLPGVPPLPPSSQLSVSVALGDGMTNEDGSITPQNHSRHSASLPSYHPPRLPPGPNLPPGAGRTSSILGELSQVTRPVVIDDGDRPFIFNAEYEAATAARMEEVLQSSPHLLYPIPSLRNKQFATPVSLPILQNNLYPPTLQPRIPAPPTSAAPTEAAYRQNVLYAQSNQAVPERAPAATRKSMSGTYKGGSSSLTGWAG